MAVEIPEKFAERIDRFGPHFIKVARAVPGDPKSGKRPVDPRWQLTPMLSDDPKLLKHLAEGGNGGVVLKNPIFAMDFDDERALADLTSHGLPPTLTVRSGSGRGFHPYYMGDLEENGEIFDAEGKSIGHIQVKFKQVVCPGSVHNSGGTYEIVNDLDITWIDKDELDEIFANSEYSVSWSHKKKLSEESAEQNTVLVGDKIPIDKVVQMDNLVNGIGPHPVHGSTGGQNFSVDLEKNCWHCFRCGSGGGPLEFMLVATGEIECKESIPGKLAENKYALFKRSLELAKEAGFDTSKAKVPETHDPTVERVTGYTLDDVTATVTANFPGMTGAVEAMLSVVVLNWFSTNKPFCLVFSGVSGSGKTTVLDMLEPYSEWTLRVDDVTAASFVTQKGGDAEEGELEDIDFLPKIQDRILITPEMSPIFSASDEALKKIIGVLTRILDGSGYMRAAGTHGLRGYKHDVKFIWVGGTVPFTWQVWKIMSKAGPRMYFYGMKEERPTPEEMTRNRKLGTYKAKVLRCRKVVWNFLQDSAEKGAIEWDVVADNEEIMNVIGQFAILLTRLRGQVIVKDLGQGMYQHWSPRIELAYKPNDALYDVARGHAALHSRDRLEWDDLGHAANIALNSAPDDRVNQFKLILEEGVITNALLANKLNCSISTARRTTRELLVLGLIERSDKNRTSGRPAREYKLHSDLKWFLSDQFAAIREELGINIEASGVFQATKRGQTVVTEGENPEPDPIETEPVVIEDPDGENWLDEYRGDAEE